MESVRKNYLYNIIYQILAIILPLVTAPYITRTLQETAIGINTFTFSLASYFTLFSLLGIPNYGVRQIARARDNRDDLSEEFISIYCLQMIVSLLVFITYTLYVLFISTEFFTIKMIQGIIVFSCTFDISWFFFGLEKFKLTVTRNIIIRILSVILIFTLVKSPDDLWKYTLIMALSNFINAVSLWSFLPRYIDFKKTSWGKINSHVKQALILLIPNIAVGLYILMDKVMLGKLSNMDEVAYYYAAEKITNLPMGVIIAFGNVMMPRTAFLADKGKHDLVKQNIRKSIKFNIILSSAIAFGISSIALVFAPFFFGASFAKAGEITVFLSIVIIFKAWANVLRKQYLIPYNRDRDFIFSVVLGALVNLIANMLLIPKYGAVGAVIGTILAEFAVALYQTVALRTELDILLYLRDNFIYLIFGAVMYFIVTFSGNYLPGNFIGIMLRVFIGVISYAGLILALSPDKQEIKGMVKSITKKIIPHKS